MHRPIQLHNAEPRRSSDEGARVTPPAIPPTDGELLLRFVRGEKEAFSLLVDRHRRVVWLVCWQVLRHRQDVEDTFQATFLILARRASSLRSVDSLAAWLHRVAHRAAVRLQTTKRRQSPLELAAEVELAEDKLQQIQRREECSILLEELRSLPDRYQTPLLLCYLEGRTRSAVADELGCTTATVKGRLARGRRMLRSRLARRGIGLSIAMAALAEPLTQAEAALASPQIAELSANCLLAHRGQPLPDGVSTQTLTLTQQGVFTMTAASLAKPICVGIALLGLTTAVIAESINETAPASGNVTSNVSVAEVQLDATQAIESAAEDITVQIAATESHAPRVTATTIAKPVAQAVIAESIEEVVAAETEVLGYSSLAGGPMTPHLQTTAAPQQQQSNKELQATLEIQMHYLSLKLKGMLLQAEAKQYHAKALAISDEGDRQQLLNEAEQLQARAEAMLLEAEAEQLRARMKELESQMKQLQQEEVSEVRTALPTLTAGPVAPVAVEAAPAVAVGQPIPDLYTPRPVIAAQPYPNTPAGPRAIAKGDRLKIEFIVGGPIIERTVVVESMGSVALGVQYGRVELEGATLAEAEMKIKDHLAHDYDSPKVQVTFERSEATSQSY